MRIDIAELGAVPSTEGDCQLYWVKFDPNQPRDERGRWTVGGVSPTNFGGRAFHGTRDTVLRDILQEGITFDPEALGNFRGYPIMSGGRARGVYITASLGVAKTYAGTAVMNHGGRPIVLELNIPHNTTGFFEDRAENASYYTHSSIRPEWITGAQVWEPFLSSRLSYSDSYFAGEGAWVDLDLSEYRKAGARIGFRFYAVLLVDDQEDTTKFNPNQPRDERGRWSATGQGSLPLAGGSSKPKPLGAPYRLTSEDARDWLEANLDDEGPLPASVYQMMLDNMSPAQLMETAIASGWGDHLEEQYGPDFLRQTGWDTGKPVFRGSPVNVFHGTSEEALRSIVKEGIVPQGGPGADEYAAAAGASMTRGLSEALIDERSASVFFATDMIEAQQFARYAAVVTHSEPVIIHARIPNDQFFSRAVEDERFVGEGAYRYVGTILPEWIQGVAYLNKADRRTLGHKDVFVVLMVDRGIEKYDPNQPRDERGRWSTTGAASASEIVARGGSPKWRNYDTQSLRNRIAEHERDLVRYRNDPEMMRVAQEFYQPTIDEIQRELAFRDAARRARVEEPRSVGDITETHNLSRESLEENSYPLIVDGVEYRIGKGVGYYPIDGGPAVMTDGLIVAGPREELLLPASDVPAVMGALEARYRDTLQGIGGGDFSQVEPPTSSGEMGRLLYGYKSPLTGDLYAQDFMGPLVEGYFNQGPVEPGGGERTDVFATALEQTEAAIASYPSMAEWARQNYEDNYTGVRAVQTMVRAIEDYDWRVSMLGQDTVNAFAYMVDQSQNIIRENHPGVDALTLYRGVTGDYADNLREAVAGGGASVGISPATSWTSDISVARRFAGPHGVVIRSSIPISSILFSHEGPRGTGLSAGDYLFGGEEEFEYIVGHRTRTIDLTRENLVD